MLIQLTSFHKSVQKFAMSTDHSVDGYLAKIAHKHCGYSKPDISLDDLKTPAEVEIAADVLSRYGVVCIPNFVSASILDNFNDVLEKVLSDVSFNQKLYPEKEHGEVKNIAWQRNTAIAKSFNQLVDYPIPIINIRGGSGNDTGMIDFFNLNKVPEFKTNTSFTTLFNSLSKGFVAQTVARVSPYRFSSMQMYKNSSVTDTRDFHIDNMLGTHKAFLYLSDVNCADDGPYCYVPSSHRIPYLHRLELRLTDKSNNMKRDIRSGKFLRHIKFLAPRGTLIISNQTGIHRGFPQRCGHVRKALVSSFGYHRKLNCRL